MCVRMTLLVRHRPLPTIAVIGALYVIFVPLTFDNPALRVMDMRAPAAKPVVAEQTPEEPPPQARSRPTMKAGL